MAIGWALVVLVLKFTLGEVWARIESSCTAASHSARPPNGRYLPLQRLGETRRRTATVVRVEGGGSGVRCTEECKDEAFGEGRKSKVGAAEAQQVAFWKIKSSFVAHGIYA